MPRRVTSVYDLDDRSLAHQIDLAVAHAAPIFRLHGWTWVTCPNVPTPDDLRNEFDRLCCILLQNPKTHYVGGGRLLVERDDSSPTGISFLLELA